MVERSAVHLLASTRERLEAAAGKAWLRRAWKQKNVALLGLGLALALGLWVRLSFILPETFPLNDGGLFYAMAHDIQTNGYAVPSHTSYNDGSIPFAYPFLPFYLAAAIDDATPWSLLDVFRFFPLITNLLTIVAVFLLARCMLRSRLEVGVAVLFFALMPRSYKWLIMGGGLTRSLGLLFAVLALHQLLLLYTRREKRFVGTSAVLAALTVLSHPEVGWFLAFSAAFLWLCYGRSRDSIARSLLVGAGVVALTAPWWATVIARDGLSPLVAAARTGGHSWDAWRSFYSWGFTEQPYVNLPAVLALLGGVVAMSRGNAFLPVWLMAIIVLEPRSAPTYATVPLAMLMSLCVTNLVLPLWSSSPAPNAPDSPAARQRGPAAPLAQIAIFFFVTYVATLSVQTAFFPSPGLKGLTEADRDSMAWVATNTEEDAAFLVLTAVERPTADRRAEWFPALTGRASLGTLQGYEWIGKDDFDRQLGRAIALQRCAGADILCIEGWAQARGATFTHVYLVRFCCQSLEQSLRQAPAYELVEDAPGAVIFARR